MQDTELNRWHGRDLYGPPRSVPLSVRLRLLLGGFNNQFGWIFFGFGMILVWLFGGSVALHNLAFFSGELAAVEGAITAVVETNVSLNDNPVYEYQYTYSVDGVSCSGATRAFGGVYKENDDVTIEYAVSNHARSRIRGLSIDSNFGMLFGAVFAVIGLVFIAFGLCKGLKGARLLRNGKEATGVLISRETTNTRVNDQTVYKYTFQFEADDQQTYEVVARTHDTELFTGEACQQTEENGEDAVDGNVREPLLYDPWNPSDAVMLDDLPGGPRISEMGKITGSLPALLLCCIIPGISVIGHTYWLLHVLEIL